MEGLNKDIWKTIRKQKKNKGIIQKIWKTTYGESKLLNNLEIPIKKLFPPLRSVWKKQQFQRKKSSRKKWFSLPTSPSLGEDTEYSYVDPKSIKRISIGKK